MPGCVFFAAVSIGRSVVTSAVDMQATVAGETRRGQISHVRFRMEISNNKIGPHTKDTNHARSKTRTGSGTPASAPKLKQAHRQILLKASLTEPLPAKRLIKDAGYTDNSYGWSLVTELARWRFLVRTPDGYLLTLEGKAQVRQHIS